MNIRLQHFCFRGGDKSEYDLFDFAGKNDSAWQEIANTMADSAFPTEPEDDRRIPNMAFANLPGKQFGEGVRIHCVYFLAERARDFRNVFCFAYRQSECSLDLLAGVTARDWYGRCVELTESQDRIELPQRTPPSDVPKLFHYDLQPNLFYLYGFPDKTGRLRSGQFRKEQWECIIKGDSHEDPPEQQEIPDPVDVPPTSPQPGDDQIEVSLFKRVISLMRRFVCSELSPLLGTLRILIVAAIGCSVGYLRGRSVGNEEGYSRGYSEGHFVGYDKGCSAGYDKGYKKGREEGIRPRKKSGGKGHPVEGSPDRPPHPENDPGRGQQPPPPEDDGTVTGSSREQQETSVNRAEGEEAPSKYPADQPHVTHSNGDTRNTDRTEPRSDTQNPRNRLRQ